MTRIPRPALALAALLLGGAGLVRADEPAADPYTATVAPLLKTYCVGCHNDGDREGDFSLEGSAPWTDGTSKGPLIRPGDSGASLLVKLMTSTGKNAMPPKGKPHPSADEIGKVRAWIDAGARRPDAPPSDRLALAVPRVEPRSATRPITALDLSRDGRLRAEARYGEVAIFEAGKDEPVRRIADFPGKVTAVHFTPDGRRLVTASGVAGLGGVAAIWNVDDGSLVRRFDGHRDLLFDAELSPDGTVLATCGYDRTIQLWDAATGSSLRTLTGHNGAVYDVAFSPDGKSLVSGSADDTCKVWRVADGARLDTLPQPLKEAFACGFSPDGKSIVAVGADNSIRVWDFVSLDEPKINPMTLARFAHEGPIHRFAFTPDGSRMVTTAGDRTIKVWDTRNYTEIQLRDHEPDLITALAVAGDGKSFRVGRIDGSAATYDIPETKGWTPAATASAEPAASAPAATAPMPEPADRKAAGAEPNNDPAHAQPVEAPVAIAGAIDPAGDVDLYRWHARAGEEWVIEVNAARSKSKLDSFVEVLDAQGGRIERVKLQATRDSYFTFRGKNDAIAADFRLFNWEEMQLDELLYANGEVVKLWLYPRGPDSGFLVYPGEGKRWGYYDTTPLAHALGEPCYIVQPHPPGATLIPNGLPVFSIGYENDDESRRELGKDSKLTFTAPADGDYLAKIRDVRGSGGPDHGYTLTIRRRQPDFRVTASAIKPVVPGGAQEFKVSAKRIDDYDGPIRVTLDGLPAGFTAPPVVIEPGQNDALGLIQAAPTATAPATPPAVQVNASATIAGQERTHPGKFPGSIQLGKPDAPRIAVGPAEGPMPPPDRPFEVDIRPGQTITLKVRVERNGAAGPILFGNEGCGRNLPYGIYVDNIGLSGLLITPEASERTFFLTADRVAAAQDRPFHLTTAVGGGQSSPAVILHVVR